MYEKVLDSIYNYRLVGGEAQSLIEIRVAMMVGEDCSIYLLWPDVRKAKERFRIVFNKYKDMPIEKYANPKLRLLYRTNLFGFGLVGLYFKTIIKRRWKSI